MNNKITDLISRINNNKKKYIGLFLWDFLSEFLAVVCFVITVKFIYFLISYLNINYTMFFNLEKILYCFILLWFFIAVIITIIFHFVTICTINKNGRGMLTENEE